MHSPPRCAWLRSWCVAVHRIILTLTPAAEIARVEIFPLPWSFRLRVANGLERVTNADSSRNDWPVKARTNYHPLFDRDGTKLQATTSE